jgi:hypothetical protein
MSKPVDRECGGGSGGRAGETGAFKGRGAARAPQLAPIAGGVHRRFACGGRTGAEWISVKFERFIERSFYVAGEILFSVSR